MATTNNNNKNRGLSALLDNKEKAKKLKQYDPDEIYPKTIHLKGSVLNVLEKLAAADKRKIKPYMETKLEELATKK